MDKHRETAANVVRDMMKDPRKPMHPFIEKALATVERETEQRVRRECAEICLEQQKVFLSPEYAIGQPESSFGERFACGILAAIFAEAGEKK